MLRSAGEASLHHIYPRYFERLSSGQRINRASDDAAGLAIYTTLTTGARVFRQVQLNLHDGILYLSIADGALNNLKTVLIRGKELAAHDGHAVLAQANQAPALALQLLAS